VAKSRPSPTAPTVVAGDAIADAVPAIPTIDLRVAQSKAEAALFGASEAVRIGRYRILERVGAGGMGIVWSAWDPELGRAVALKLASSGDAEARALARDEARALARLSHPNVVPIYDVLDHDERVFLVMELVKGETLRAAGRARTPAQLIRDYRQAADGLAAAHRAGLIHRDFKPDNAILGDDGRVRVLDFGLADEAGGGDGRVAGTRGYMAPEQEAGAALTEAVDQYALCVSLREALVARGGVPRWLAPLLARGTAARPEERFPSMEALAAALALDPMTRWRRRGLVAGAALAVAAAGGAFWLGQARSSERVEPCSGAASSIAASWGPARRAELARHLTRAGRIVRRRGRAAGGGDPRSLRRRLGRAAPRVVPGSRAPRAIRCCLRPAARVPGPPARGAGRGRGPDRRDHRR
jgi:predicted Ser/Thr protein kinase